MIGVKGCTCVRCDACRGSGTIWFDFRGRYLGNSRCDDLDEMESCEECRGSGITETCDHCSDMADLEADRNEQWEAAHR
jgi:hypothetical protein